MDTNTDNRVKVNSFGDRRLTKRLSHLVKNLTNSPASSVPKALNGAASTKAAYRFWSSNKVTPQKILKEHKLETIKKVADYKRVLLIQDTSAFDFSSLNKVEDMGYLGGKTAPRGMLMHTVLAATPEGVPIGLLDQKHWVRKDEEYGKKHQRSKKKINEKESYRWIEAFEAGMEGLSKETEVVTITDREGDIYDFLATERPPNAHLLIRARHNRRIKQEMGRAMDEVRESPCLGQISITVKHSRERDTRTVKLDLRVAEIDILPPSKSNKSSSTPIKMRMILAEEVSPPKGVKGICWYLLTSLEVKDLQDAKECIYYYSLRWLIERFHYVLKSGCKVEDLQLSETRRLQNAIATFSLVAWRLLWLLYESRVNPKRSCEEIFNKSEWQLLYKKFNPKSTRIPNKAPALEKIINWIARLGGFLNRKNDGDPGVKTLWLGLQTLNNMTLTLKILELTMDD